jgi:hypothetical protein
MTPEPRRRSPRIKEGIAPPPAAAQRIQQYLRDSVPDKHKIAAERALLKKIPPAAAIKQKCLACCNYSREDVRECGVVICPLNPYRPYQDDDSPGED